MTASAGPALHRLYAEFGRKVDFLSVFVREAHPGDRYPQPHDLRRKIQHARAYRERDAISWPIAVDDIEGTFHRALDDKPNAAYVMSPDGLIARRVLWSNDPRGVREALRAVLEGQPHGEREAKISAMMRGLGVMRPTLEAAGPTALRDLRREAPPVYLIARIAAAFKPLPPPGGGGHRAGLRSCRRRGRPRRRPRDAPRLTQPPVSRVRATGRSVPASCAGGSGSSSVSTAGPTPE